MGCGNLIILGGFPPPHLEQLVPARMRLEFSESNSRMQMLGSDSEAGGVSVEREAASIANTEAANRHPFLSPILTYIRVLPCRLLVLNPKL